MRIPDGPELSIDVDAVLGPADSGELGADLAGLFVEIGGVARDHGTGILLAIDELHYVDLPTFTALIVGSAPRRRRNGYPITDRRCWFADIGGTDRTKPRRTRSACSVFARVDSLTVEQAVEALATAGPRRGGRGGATGALEAALAVTQCYPYFLQEFGRHAWDVADGPDDITEEEFAPIGPTVGSPTLDDGFFRVRAGASTTVERTYMRAMAELGPGPVGTAEVAALLGRPVTTVSSVRDGLIKRALCYAPERGKIDFTVPLFGGYLKRWMPELG